MCKNLSVQSLLSLLQLLNLSEADSISYLDEVANSPGSLDLAKSVALEVSFLSILWTVRNAGFYQPIFIIDVLFFVQNLL